MLSFDYIEKVSQFADGKREANIAFVFSFLLNVLYASAWTTKETERSYITELLFRRSYNLNI